MNSMAIHVGIDVSKAMLDLDPFDGKDARVKNTTAGINKLIRRIQAYSAEVIICCESSGGYEKPLLAILVAHGIGVSCVNARWVRDFARSRGILAKTDAIDAQVLSIFGATNKPRLLSPTPDWQLKIKGLLIRRDELLCMQKQERSRLEPHPDAEIRQLINRHIRILKNHITSIEGKLKKIISEENELSYKFKRLCSVKSIGLVSALSLLAFMPELGMVSDNQATALAGLAPFNRDSGTMKGKRMIQGGRSRVRTPLYMAAVCASKSNPVLRDVYERLRYNGKPAKVAITALMRKLVVLANRLMADPLFEIS